MSSEEAKLENDVRLARAEDIDSVLATWNEAAAWLRESGINQWPASFDVTDVRSAQEAGILWVAVRRGMPVAAMNLTWVDPLWPDDSTAVYVHRLAVSHRGRGWGASLLRAAVGIAADRDRGRVRLDCIATNRTLRRYYESLGFAHRGDVEVAPADVPWRLPPPITLSRYERPAGDLNNNSHCRAGHVDMNDRSPQFRRDDD